MQTNKYSGVLPMPKIDDKNDKTSDDFNKTIKKRHINDGDKIFWDNNDIFSVILPDICYSRSNNEEDIDISYGKKNKGVLGKDSLGTVKGSIFHVTWNDIGVNETKDLFNNISYVANYWTSHRGFSVGLKDCIIQDKSKTVEIKKVINNLLKLINKIIEHIAFGKKVINIDPKEKEQLEKNSSEKW